MTVHTVKPRLFVIVPLSSGGHVDGDDYPVFAFTNMIRRRAYICACAVSILLLERLKTCVY